MYKILVADDEVEIVELLELYLEKEGYEIIKCYDGIEAWNILSNRKVDLAILDIMIPGLDGYKLVRKVRESMNIPVIMLSAKNGPNDKILGLGLGADDYVTKPFDPLELMARVSAQIRRYYNLKGSNEKEDESLVKRDFGRLSIDESKCLIYKDNEEISMTSTEYKILRLVMINEGRVFTKKQIFEQVWEEEYYGEDNTIMVHISKIRDKIEDNPKKPAFLVTVRGLGYKFQSGN